MNFAVYTGVNVGIIIQIMRLPDGVNEISNLHL